MSQYIPKYGLVYRLLKSVQYFLVARKWVSFDKFALGSFDPVLVAVLKTRHFESIQEIGGGFLSSRLFAEYAEVVGSNHCIYESNVEWLERIEEVVGNALNTTIHPIRSQAIDTSDSSLVGLGYGKSLFGEDQVVFIDDGQISDDRVKTINTVVEELKSVAVIHDAQTPAYRHALDHLEQRGAGVVKYYDQQLPSTAVFVPKELFRKDPDFFKALNKQLRALRHYSGSSEVEFFAFCREELEL